MTEASRPRPPLLSRTLAAAPARLEDEASWADVLATGPVAASGALRDIVLRRARFVEASFAGQVIERLRCENVEFVRCDMSGAVWDGSALDRVAFLGCRMTGLTLSGAKLADVRIEDCGAELANFRMSKALRLHAESSMLRAADFYEATLARSRLVQCDLRAASFARATTKEVSLRGSKLDDIAGAGSLRGTLVDPDQAVLLGRLLLAEAGITVFDPLSPGE